jgi:hypothetical protein
MSEKAVIEDEDLIEPMDVEPEEIDAEEADDVEEGEGETPEPKLAEAEDDAEELIVTIGEASPPSEDETKAPAWVREVRKQNRELARKNRELEAQLGQAKQRDEPQLGPKPTLESVDYDTGRYERALDEWKERKAHIDRKKAEQQQAQQKELDRWQSEIETFKQQKASLKVRDFEDAEDVVSNALNQTQLGIIVDGAQNKALVMYALGKNEKALADLAQITNPVKFAFAVARMETQLKTQSRKPAVTPEKTPKGSAPVSPGDSQLERLRSKAEQTGDYSEVFAYKKKLREKRGS